MDFVNAIQLTFDRQSDRSNHKPKQDYGRKRRIVLDLLSTWLMTRQYSDEGKIEEELNDMGLKEVFCPSMGSGTKYRLLAVHYALIA